MLKEISTKSLHFLIMLLHFTISYVFEVTYIFITGIYLHLKHCISTLKALSKNSSPWQVIKPAFLKMKTSWGLYLLISVGFFSFYPIEVKQYLLWVREEMHGKWLLNSWVLNIVLTHLY